MPKVYIIDTRIANKDTGPDILQSSRMKDGYNYESKNSVRGLPFFRNKIPDFEPDLDYFLLHRSAKISDVISVQGLSEFLVSERTKLLMEKLRLPEHIFFPAKLGYNDEHLISDYYLFHLASSYMDKIDFTRTQFYFLESCKKDDLDKFSGQNVIEVKEKWRGSKHLWVKVGISARNPTELLELSRKRTKEPLTEKYYFKDDFMIKHDFFHVGDHDIRIYASEKAKQSFESEKITGIEFHECRWLE